MLGQIMERLQKEFEQAGKLRQFMELKGFLIGDRGNTTYAHAAANLKMTEAAANQAATRLRRRYRELLRDEIAHTVSDATEVQDEIRRLFATLEM